MIEETDLVRRSLAILRAGQAPSGAFLASPTFPTYRYSWFRDGTFIAHALDLWGEHDAARRYYHWGVEVVLGHRQAALAALAGPAHRAPRQYLHTRYTVDGTIGNDDWPNFQLDGFGTFLWGMAEHLVLTGIQAAPARWLECVDLLIAYLGHLWRAPGYDCWEEFPDKVHLATVAALAAGLRAAARQRAHAGDLATEICRFIVDQSDGFLRKFVGSDAVDASLLWTCVPFELLSPEHQLMRATVSRVRHELMGPGGGVHRYADDTYYGGGAWILLTANLAECLLAQGDVDGAEALRGWIEQRADAAGNLPEQVPVDLHQPEMYQVWVDRWGEIATPLLWSHAGYLRLVHRLEAARSTEEIAS